MAGPQQWWPQGEAHQWQHKEGPQWQPEELEPPPQQSMAGQPGPEERSHEPSTGPTEVVSPGPSAAQEVQEGSTEDLPRQRTDEAASAAPLIRLLQTLSLGQDRQQKRQRQRKRQQVSCEGSR